jgi:hypothetical protein
MFLCTECCELKVVHKKQRHHFIFWWILTIHTSFEQELSHCAVDAAFRAEQLKVAIP